MVDFQSSLRKAAATNRVVQTTVACEKCGSPMILRDSKRGPFLGCSSFPKCRSTKMMKKLEGADLKQVEALVPLLKEGAEKARELVAKIIGDNPAAAGNGHRVACHFYETRPAPTIAAADGPAAGKFAERLAAFEAAKANRV